MQCSFCGYLNDQRASTSASILGVCTLCHEVLRQDVVVGWQQFMQDVRPNCATCARELLLNETCSYCTALHATVPTTLLTRLSFFSEVLRSLNLQGAEFVMAAEQAAPRNRPRADTEDPLDTAPAPASPLRPPTRPARAQRTNIWQTSSTFWSPRFSPPPFQAADGTNLLSVPALDFGVLDLDALLVGGDGYDGGGEEEEDTGGLSDTARATMLRAPVSVADDFMCGVCLAPAEGAEEALLTLTELPCAHVFHANCVNQWFMNHRTCPMCRRLVTAPRPQQESTSQQLPPLV